MAVSHGAGRRVRRAFLGAARWGPWVPRVGVLVDRQGGTRQVQGHHQGHSVAACADLGRPSPDPQATPTGGIGLCMSPTPIMQQGVATARSVPTIFAGFFAAASSTPPHISKTDHVGEPCFTHPLRSAPRPTRPLPTAWLPWSSPCQLLKFPNLCVWCVWVVVQGVRSCHGLVGCTELVATKSLAMTTLMPSSRLGSSPAPPPPTCKGPLPVCIRLRFGAHNMVSSQGICGWV